MIGKVVLAVAGLVLVASAMFVVVPGRAPASDSDIVERWVSANHLRLYIHGRWEDLPMMPLADHLCESGNAFFERYCEPHSSDRQE